MELYGTGRIREASHGCRRNLNVDGVHALGLRACKRDGTPWNVNRAANRQMAYELVMSESPTWIWGSPPCTSFPRLDVNLNVGNMQAETVAAKLREGKRHLHCMLSSYKLLLSRGLHVLHEHHATPTSWQDSQMQALLNDRRVKVVTSDQCEYGLATPDSQGNLMAAKKPTSWATTSPQMAARLSRRCSGLHSHQHLLGGGAQAASYYAMGLTTEILKGIQDTEDAKLEHDDPLCCGENPGAISQHVALAHDSPTGLAFAPAEEEQKHKAKIRVTTMKHENGTEQSIDMSKIPNPVYKDEYTDEQLPQQWVEDAIVEEL